MSGWGIDYNSGVAERICDSVCGGKHLKGFDSAEHKLGLLKSALEKILFDAEWWGEKCYNAANHYQAMQKDLAERPGDFSESHAREAVSKSPQTLFAYADELKSGQSRLHDAITSVDEMLKRLQNAKHDATEGGKKVTVKISHAIELMARYLHVDF